MFLMKRDKGECPMKRVPCAKCNGYARDRMECEWGYHKVYPEPSLHPGKKGEPKSRW